MSRPAHGPLSVPVAVAPIDEAPPTREDHKRTLALESFLEQHGRVERGDQLALDGAAQDQKTLDVEKESFFCGDFVHWMFLSECDD